MKKIIAILANLLMSTLAYGLACNTNKMTEDFCHDLAKVEKCLKATNDCGSYVADAMVWSVMYLGSIDTAATQFHRGGILTGEIRYRFLHVVKLLEDHSWQVVTRDPNWLVASVRINEITKEYAEYFKTLEQQQ